MTNPPTVQTPTRTINRRRGLVAALTISITSLLAIAAVAAAWQFGWLLADNPAASPPSTAALSTETQMECTSIRREFESWDAGAPREHVQVVLPARPRDVVKFELDRLKEDGDALLKAVSGYSDQPSKELATATANYNVDLAVVTAEHVILGEVSTGTKEKAVRTAGAVETAYKAFMQRTCGES